MVKAKVVDGKLTALNYYPAPVAGDHEDQATGSGRRVSASEAERRLLASSQGASFQHVEQDGHVALHLRQDNQERATGGVVDVGQVNLSTSNQGPYVNSSM